jgi:anaerobic magnesium-protoporphyrin IX monomethyl ester cyclase
MTTPRAVLIYPPVTDPTSGYHSLSYIDSYAQALGHPAADMIDANIEAFHYSYSPAGQAFLAENWGKAPAADPLGQYDATQWKSELLRIGEPDPDGVRAAVKVLQDRELFYQYDRYSDAAEAVISWMNCLSTTGYVGQFDDGFQLRMPPLMSIGSIAALTNPAALERLNRPFQPYYDDVLIPRLAAGGYDIIGINVTYQWQLPFALWIARLIRAALPGVFLVGGGTEVSDVWKYLRDKGQMFTVFDDLDGVVVGEGESAWVSILDSIGAGTLPQSHPNVRLHPKYGAGRSLPLFYEPIKGLPTPDFSRLPWDQYLSPERFVYYSPSRGCYWNKCTFCDYGLNGDGPTSPWRQDTVESMITDVTALSQFAKFIYLSVDVLAPATILKFAEQVVERNLDFRWGAEIRLEKYWSAERCEMLRKSGCVAVSVGLESANQRVLDLIDKGTRPAQVKQTIVAMTKADIGVQMMGFTGFPTETEAEAIETVDFLADNRDLWTFGGLGEFVLTSGAIVAKDPDRFGLANVRPLEGADIERVLQYDEPVTEAARLPVSLAKAKLDDTPYLRPWLGSIDTPHTYLYHDRYGTGIRSAMARDRMRRDDDDDCEFVANGVFIDRPDDDVVVRHNANYQIFRGGPVPEDWILFRMTSGKIMPLPQSYRMFLDMFAEPTTLREARYQAWMIDTASVNRLWQTLISRRLVRRCPPSTGSDAIE